VRLWRRWSLLFVAIGMNSLAFYLLRHLLADFLHENLERHFGAQIFQTFGAEFQPVMIGSCSLIILLGIVLAMHRHKFYFRL
jgi:hypothetical protein